MFCTTHEKRVEWILYYTGVIVWLKVKDNSCLQPGDEAVKNPRSHSNTFCEIFSQSSIQISTLSQIILVERHQALCAVSHHSDVR
jgi:hypothetical protein